jgi:argininosuccinate lyase
MLSVFNTSVRISSEISIVFFDSVKTIEISLDILTDVLKTLNINSKNMEQACKIGHLTATDLADYLVQKASLPFRTAYYITKDVVSYANKLHKDISELTIEELRDSTKELKNIDEDIILYLNLRNSMNARNSYGGTSTKQTKQQIKEFKLWLKKVKNAN